MATIIEAIYLLLFFATPLTFTSLTSELFEVPKMYFVYLSTATILFFHLLNWLKGKVPLLSKNKFTVPFLIFYSTQLLSTFFSADIHTSIFGYYSRLNGGLLSLTAYLILFLILSVYITPKFKQKIITFSLLSGALVALYGILQHFGIDKNRWVQDVQTRVFSSFGQPNWLAAYLCILLPFAVDRFLKSKSKVKFTIYFLLFTIYYLCLLFTKSKSGIIAAIISLAIYFIIKIFQKTNFKNLTIPLLIFLSTSLIISNPIKDTIFPSNIPQSTYQNDTLNITPSEDIRKIVWTGAVDLWRQFPLLGTGPETFAYSYYWTRPASHNLTSEWDFLYNKAHNEYLNYLATTGAFGFLSYLFLILSFLISCFSSPALLASFISILITNFAGFSVVVSSLYFFLLPALAQPTPKHKNVINKSSPPLLFLPLVLCFLFLISKIFSFFLADINYNYAQKYSSHQLYPQAEIYIQKAISARPKEAIYHGLASSIYASQNKIIEAQRASDLAINLCPASTNLWKERAQVYAQLSVSDPKLFIYALEALEKNSLLAPTDAKTFYLLGRFYAAAGEEEIAIKNYKKALDLKANDDYSALDLGKIYFDKKDYSNAKKYFEIVLKYAPTSDEAKEYLEKMK